MHQLAVFSDVATSVETLHRQLGGTFDLRCRNFRRIPDQDPDLYTVVDTSLKDSERLLDLKQWISRKPKDGKVVFVVDKNSRIEVARAHALGASAVLHRPINRRQLMAEIWGDFGRLTSSIETEKFRAENAPGVVAAFDALQNIFSSSSLGGAVDPVEINAAGDKILAHIGEQGLGGWIAAVRKHHSQTYQHSLLVTGLAVAFGHHLGVGQDDKLRLSFAGLLHDIGKARIPVSILEKPGPLDLIELEVMRSHPQLGTEALSTVAGVGPEMLDIVLHHHEYLDGSGYPDGLHGHDICDLVRIVTIADVFGALVERRSYKPPLSGEAAFQMLTDMGPKLDADLVREFRPVALSLRRG
jgi:putative nucleotidyltransferase with HDIG domain